MTSFFEQSDVCYQGMGILPQFDRPDAVIVFSVDNFYLDYLHSQMYEYVNQHILLPYNPLHSIFISQSISIFCRNLSFIIKKGKIIL